ncbi:hydrolase [Kordia sp.]|uniref:hydrolase n=1 Tax=Kordia sp. TaxID=1965332 RepID=UPI003D2CAF3F
MTKRILGYALIFVILLALYQYVNTNRMYEKMNEKIEKLRTERDDMSAQIEVKRDSIDVLINENIDLSYFTLRHNAEALEYFEKYQFTDDLAQYIEDVIYDKNSTKNDNPLVPFSGMDGVFVVDKVKVINHKWALCSFTDGGYWGEMILSYEIDKDKNLTFETVAELLYNKYTK